MTQGIDSVPQSDDSPAAAGVLGLEAAFLHFVEATRELESSQRKLSDEVHRLTHDLARSNADLKHQIEAKKHLAEELAALLSALPTGVITLNGTRVYAFNAVSARHVPDLRVSGTWSVPRHWTALGGAHYRCDDHHDAEILRLEHHRLAEDRSMLLLHDVTATFKAREQIERESKLAAMGRMAAEIAHQIRTPLATAMLYAGHLSNPRLDPQRKERFSGLLHQQLAWLDGLASRMMSFLRHRAGDTQLICVEELLEECCSSIEPLFDSRGVSLDLAIRGGQHLLNVERDQIRGGIVSILENALQVSTEGQSVLVHAEAARSRLDIMIEDCGPGIPTALLGRLFEPFATGSPRGTGLGLAIAKSAVESHRGMIQAENRPQGGARFHIVLPVLEQL